MWAAWNEWGVCSEWCNNGTQNRTRQCVGPYYGGLECPGEPEQVQDCFLKHCPSTSHALCHTSTAYHLRVNLAIDQSPYTPQPLKPANLAVKISIVCEVRIFEQSLFIHKNFQRLIIVCNKQNINYYRL